MSSKTGSSLFCRSIILSLMATCSHAAVNVATTFSSTEGYISGSIDKDDNPGQSLSWERVNAATATSFVVGPPGIVVNPIAANTAQAVYQAGLNLSEGAVTTYVDFTFSQSATAVTSNQTVIGMAFLDNATSGNRTGFSGIFGLTTDGYRLSWGTTVSNITAAQLGIDLGASDFQSIPLRMSMTLTRTGTADTFTRVASLINLTNGSTITVTAAGAGPSFTDATAYADTSLYSSIQTSYTTATQITGLTIQGFGITQVPEPGAVALSLTGGLLLFGRRRR